jgi:hypothetical protein
MNITLKNLIKNRTAEFVCYRDGDLWYRIAGSSELADGETGEFTFEFPVPVQDTGTGIFSASTKSITLMRWVRRHLEKIQKGQWQ